MNHNMAGHNMASHNMAGHTMPGHDMPADDTCSMNMSFTWDFNNLCIVFPWWHIKQVSGLIISCLAIIMICIGYEYYKQKTKKWETLQSRIRVDDDNSGSATSNNLRIIKSINYGILVGYSYLIMLLFMTFNGFIMLSVVIGAGLGNYLYGGEIRDTMACH